MSRGRRCMPERGITHATRNPGNLNPNPNRALGNAQPGVAVQQNSDVRHRLRAKLAILRLFGVVATIAGITALCFEVFSANATTAGFSYLMAILFVATTWGLLEAITASITAGLCLNFYFLPPVGALTIADRHNWVALSA